MEGGRGVGWDNCLEVDPYQMKGSGCTSSASGERKREGER